MADYFTSDHFNLLNKWKGQKRDESNPEQNRAYEDLKKAYEVTEAWANAVKTRLFPAGVVKIRKRPTSQANSFLHYNWARIYPSAESPEVLAYTVGIDAEAGFVVKIDTVQADAALRARYETLRGSFDNLSPIIAILPTSDGLAKSLAELVEWSATAIHGFRLRLDEVATKLQILQTLNDEDVLKHFDGNPAFKAFRETWASEPKKRFCRLARAVHAAGLDWWHMGKALQVRFGRKNPGSERALRVLGVVRGSRTQTISWAFEFGDIPELKREPLTDKLTDKIEETLSMQNEFLSSWMTGGSVRAGLWPDQLLDDPSDPGEDNEETDIPNAEPRKQAFNRIYYGPPGTGKTYGLQQLLSRDYERAPEAVSSDEWRQGMITEHIASLTWWEGAAATLYDLGKPAKVADIYAHPFIQAIIKAKGRTKNVHQTLWGTLQHHAIETSKTVKIKQRLAPEVFDKSEDAVWFLAGDWEDECAEIKEIVDRLRQGPGGNTQPIKRYSFVTFHQSYGYEEFVEGLRPILDSSTNTGQVSYEIRAGAFRELCRKARSAPDHRFAMVIDEINRGNISKIFGELITLIELDKRDPMDGSKPPVEIELAYSGEKFSVPCNVDIIGTMNTADRSLALVDTALRRRFDFVALMPDTRDVADSPLQALVCTMGERVIDIRKLLQRMNERIETLYDRDHTIGHAYFTALRQKNPDGTDRFPDGNERFRELAYIFRNRIIPLLEEYFFEDWQKIRLVLDDNQKVEGARFISVHEDQESELSSLFGSDHELDTFATKKRYELESDAFDNPDSYIGVYSPVGT